MDKNRNFCLQNKAKRKYKDRDKLFALYRLDSESKQAYASAIYCANTIQIVDGKTRTQYCKRKCCTVCNSIRAKQRYNRIADLLTGNLMFTTLTVPNCTEEELPEVERKMKKVLRRIIKTIDATADTKTFGVWNLEESINAKGKNYHPHLHLLHSQVECWITGHALKPYTPKNADRTSKIGKYTEGTQQKIYYANKITKLWLKYFPDAKPYLQCVVPLHETDDFNKREVFKYSCKPFAFAKKPKNVSYTEYLENIKEDWTTYITMYDKLFTYQRKNKCRNFASFGLEIHEMTEEEENTEIGKEHDTVDEIQNGAYEWHGHDWWNLETGESLTGFIPEEKHTSKHELLKKFSNEKEHDPPERRRNTRSTNRDMLHIQHNN
jgi:Replication protein